MGFKHASVRRRFAYIQVSTGFAYRTALGSGGGAFYGIAPRRTERFIMYDGSERRTLSCVMSYRLATKTSQASTAV